MKISKLFLVLVLFLDSCVALSQDDLMFLDFTSATTRPDFVLRDMKNGGNFNSADHEDSAYVIEFYFNTCPACNQNAENVKRLQEEFSSNPKVQIIEVSIDCEDNQYRNWIEKHSPLGPVLNGCGAELINDLNVSRFPTTYVFSPSKREAMRGMGVWSNQTYSRIKAYLNQVK